MIRQTPQSSNFSALGISAYASSTCYSASSDDGVLIEYHCPHTLDYHFSTLDIDAVVSLTKLVTTENTRQKHFLAYGRQNSFNCMALKNFGEVWSKLPPASMAAITS